MARGITQRITPPAYVARANMITLEWRLKFAIVALPLLQLVLPPIFLFFENGVYGFVLGVLIDALVVGLVLIFFGKKLGEMFAIQVENLILAIVTNKITGGFIVFKQGFHFKWPWESLGDKENDLISLELLTTDDKKPVRISTFSKDGIKMYIDWTLLYRPDPDLILVYRGVDKDDSVIRSGLISTVNGILSQISSEMTANDIRAGVASMMKKVDEALKVVIDIGITDTGDEGPVEIKRSLQNRFGVIDIQPNISDADYSKEIAGDLEARKRSELVSQAAERIRTGNPKVEEEPWFINRVAAIRMDSEAAAAADPTITPLTEQQAVVKAREEYRGSFAGISAKEALNQASVNFKLATKSITEVEASKNDSEAFVKILTMIANGGRGVPTSPPATKTTKKKGGS